MDKQRILITSALPYANGPLHFGHIAGAFLPADVYSRFRRLLGDDVLYICGSDEYGFAVSLSAELAQKKPQEHVDLYHVMHQDFFKKFNIAFDHYSRTTSPIHAETVVEFFKDLHQNGWVEERVTKQLYSEADRRFLADRYVVGTCPKCGFEEARGDECPRCAASFEAIDLIHPRSKISKAPLTLKKTKHWFLRFDQFKDQLHEWLSCKSWKSNVLAFVKHYIDTLKPRAITRDSDWGIPLPIEGEDGKVFYVWFDAPIGYISATREWAQKQEKPLEWEKYWFSKETKYVQFIGKDNIPFHAIFFPAMIMGQNRPYKLVDELPANEFYNFEGKKFNKSTGWTIDIQRFFSQFTADQIRYTIAANAPETSDSEFSWKDFQLRVNGDLVGKYGNFANRVLTFIDNQLGEESFDIGECDEIDQEFLAAIEQTTTDITHAYNAFKLRQAAQLVMHLATLGNVYFDRKKPWALIKEVSDKAQLITTLSCCLHSLKVLALVSYPIIPEAAMQLWDMLGIQVALTNVNFKATCQEVNLKVIHLKKPKRLFSKIEDHVIEEEINQLKSKEQNAQTKAQEKALISFEQFQSMDLRVGQILSVENVPKSHKLLKLVVDIGMEKRTIVSGIAKAYADQHALIGKKVIVVANLKPAKLMGIQSEGMILAAGDDPLEIPFLVEAKVGAKVS